MNWFQRLLHRNKLEQQLDAELRFHLDQRVADNMRAGMSEQQARRSARLEFGGLEQLKEGCRDARGTLWLETAIQDLRFAARTLRKSPAFTLAAIGACWRASFTASALIAATYLASYIPARRATTVDPLLALRHE